ncbi:hypothetical protein [Photobacterium nomapromontoriensis]|uniref:hypothetical protein n=1 Tax=Photobacterium nomapromontoriensis TaxID=2910237 RepID=UPI003D0F6FE2
METELQAKNDGELNHIEALESHSEQEERDFLKGLDDDFDPTIADSKGQQQELETEAAAAIVFVGMMTIEQFMKTLAHPKFKFDPDQAETVANKVAPLLVKYGTNPPPWLAKYMEEIMAVAAIGMLGLSSYLQVKQLKAEDIAVAKEKAKQAANNNNAEAAA